MNIKRLTISNPNTDITYDPALTYTGGYVLESLIETEEEFKIVWRDKEGQKEFVTWNKKNVSGFSVIYDTSKSN